MKMTGKVPNLKFSKRIVKALTYIACFLLIILVILFSVNMDRLYRNNIFEQALNNVVILSNTFDIENLEDKTEDIINNTNISSIYIVEKVYLNYNNEFRYSCTFDIPDNLTEHNPINDKYTIKYLDKVFEDGKPCTSKSIADFLIFNRNAVGFAPVYDETGNIISVICVEIPMGFGFPYIQIWSAVLYGIIFVMVAICIVFSFKFNRQKVIQPFEKIGNYAKTFMTPETYKDIVDYDETDAIDIIVHAVDNMREKQERLDESLEYAKAIQERLLTGKEECRKYFSDFDVWWYPLAVVSGDFYKLHHYPKGTLLIMGDCTGHGIPGALMTMMVSTIIENSIVADYCDDTRNILWTLDRQLSVILNAQRSEKEVYITHGLDIIVLFIDNNKNIQMSSAGMHFFIASSSDVQVMRGQRLFIGDGKIENKRKIKTSSIKGRPDNTYYIATDGLFEQIGGDKKIPFGYSRFKKIIMKKNAEKISSSIEAVKYEYFDYKGNLLRLDDVTVIGFKL